MGTFLSYSTKLRQYVPALAPEQAEDFIQQAWRDIRDSYGEWSFLARMDYWLAPASVTLSGVEVVQHDDGVALTHDHLAQLGGLNNPALTLRQIRIGSTGGPIYSISASDVQMGEDGGIGASSTTFSSADGPFSSDDVGKLIRVAGAGAGGADLDSTITSYTSPTSVELADAAGTTVSNATFYWGSELTLDRLYRESSNSAATALIYRIYFSPSSTDFNRLDHLIDQTTGYEFGWTVDPIDDLDRIDPRRSATEQSFRIYFSHWDQVSGLPVFELWPGPTSERAFTVHYWGRGEDFAEEDEALPAIIPEELLLTRARILAYEWAMVVDEDVRRRQSYMAALQYVRGRYSSEGVAGRASGLLEQARLRDRGIYSRVQRGPKRSGAGFPTDSNFMRSHAIPSWMK